jgi:hypothetical protein
VINKKTTAKKVLMYHNGRATQEIISGKLKSQSQLRYIAARVLYGNQMCMMAATTAHNLNRKLQMAVKPKKRGTMGSHYAWTSICCIE